MSTLIRRVVRVDELPAAWRAHVTLPPETFVTVTVEAPEPPPSGRPLRDFIGSGRGLFASIEEVDDFIRRERESWHERER
jgi:hypothetical protein